MICEECGGEVILLNGERVCKQCGLVQNSVVIESNPFSLASKKGDYKQPYKPVSETVQTVLRRGKKLTKPSNSGFKREILRIATQLSLPRYVVETALRIYAEKKKEGVVFKSTVAAGAIVYVACLIHNYPLLPTDLKSVGLPDKKVLRIASKKFKEITNQPIKSYERGIDYINVICNRVDAPHLFELSTKIYRELVRSGFYRRPLTLAALSVLLAARVSNTNVSNKAICKVAGITSMGLYIALKALKENTSISNEIKNVLSNL